MRAKSREIAGFAGSSGFAGLETRTVNGTLGRQPPDGEDELYEPRASCASSPLFGKPRGFEGSGTAGCWALGAKYSSWTRKLPHAASARWDARNSHEARRTPTTPDMSELPETSEKRTVWKTRRGPHGKRTKGCEKKAEREEKRKGGTRAARPLPFPPGPTFAPRCPFGFNRRID